MLFRTVHIFETPCSRDTAAESFEICHLTYAKGTSSFTIYLRRLIWCERLLLGLEHTVDMSRLHGRNWDIFQKGYLSNMPPKLRFSFSTSL